MNGVVKVFYNIIRGFVRLAFRIPIFIAQALIYAATFEPGKVRVLTPRKARRIRALTKLKLWFLNSLPTFIAKYLGVEEYKEYLNLHLSHVL